jgi:hypothetical protein
LPSSAAGYWGYSDTVGGTGGSGKVKQRGFIRLTPLIFGKIGGWEAKRLRR